MGMDISLPSGKSLIFSFFEGSHQENKMFVSSLDESKGVLMEISDRFGSSEVSYQFGMTLMTQIFRYFF